MSSPVDKCPAFPSFDEFQDFMKRKESAEKKAVTITTSIPFRPSSEPIPIPSSSKMSAERYVHYHQDRLGAPLDDIDVGSPPSSFVASSKAAMHALSLIYGANASHSIAGDSRSNFVKGSHNSAVDTSNRIRSYSAPGGVFLSQPIKEHSQPMESYPVAFQSLSREEQEQKIAAFEDELAAVGIGGINYEPSLESPLRMSNESNSIEDEEIVLQYNDPPNPPNS